MSKQCFVVGTIDDDEILSKALARLPATYDCEVEVYDSAEDFLAAPGAPGRAVC